VGVVLRETVLRAIGRGQPCPDVRVRIPSDPEDAAGFQKWVFIGGVPGTGSDAVRAVLAATGRFGGPGLTDGQPSPFSGLEATAGGGWARTSGFGMHGEAVVSSWISSHYDGRKAFLYENPFNTVMFEAFERMYGDGARMVLCVPDPGGSQPKGLEEAVAFTDGFLAGHASHIHHLHVIRQDRLAADPGLVLASLFATIGDPLEESDLPTTSCELHGRR